MSAFPARKSRNTDLLARFATSFITARFTCRHNVLDMHQTVCSSRRESGIENESVSAAAPQKLEIVLTSHLTRTAATRMTEASLYRLK